MKKLLSFLIMLITVMPYAQADLNHSVARLDLEQVKRDIANGARVSVENLHAASEAAAGGDNTAFILLQFLIEHGGKAVINEITGKGTILDYLNFLVGKPNYPAAPKVISYLQSQGAIAQGPTSYRPHRRPNRRRGVGVI